MRTLLPLLAAVALALAIATPAEARKNASLLSPDLRRAIAAAEALAAHTDPATAAIAFEAIASHPDFERLEPRRRSSLLLRGARLAIDGGEFARAHGLARAAVEADPSDADGWFLSGQLAASEQRHDEAAAAFARLARQWPESLAHLPLPIVNQTILRAGSGENGKELLEALHEAGWTLDGIPADHAWARLALLRNAAGDAAGARELAAGIGAPEIITWMRSDRRFDGLFERDLPRFEPARAADAWIERLAGLAEASPSSLPLQRELVHGLLVAGRPEAALALAAEALAAPDRFDDIGELAWMHNLRAVALRRLGRTDEALAALADGAALDESGQPNVSQVLNLGTLLVDLGRPRDALSTVARVEGMSGYGLLVQATIRMRAHRQLGQPRDAEVWLDRIRAGREDGPMALLHALLWSGLADEAAELLQDLLGDPDRRTEALEWCQEFLASEPLPARLPMVQARRSLLARDDVRAAIDAVGRIEETGIYGSPGID